MTNTQTSFQMSRSSTKKEQTGKFAEAVLRKRQEEKKPAIQKRILPSQMFTVEKLNTLIEDFLHALLTKESKSALATILNKVPRAFTASVTSWSDSHQLDILHHAILHGRADFVEYLTSESSFFPPSHQPQICPYAHLSARIGQANCLRVILTNRPNDFFKCNEPHHNIKLPAIFCRKYRLSDRPNRSTKKLDAILNKIKKFTEGRGLEKLKSIAIESSDTEGTRKSVDNRKPTKSIMEFQNSQTSLSVIKQTISNTSSTKSVCDTVSMVTTQPVKEKKPKKPSKPKDRIIIHMEEFQSETGRASLWKHGILLPPIPSPGRGLISAETSNNEMNNKNSGRSTTPRGRSLHLTKAAGNKASPQIGTVELGVRRNVKMKEFKIKYPERKVVFAVDKKTYMNKTPLTFAAENGNIECIKLILDIVVAKKNPRVEVKEPLTLATHARSPHSILLILKQKYTVADYQGAILVAIRKMYPECLASILSLTGREKKFSDPINYYHRLFTQTIGGSVDTESLPVMTHVLISSGEDVNASLEPGTFPLYTLIYTALSKTAGKNALNILKCMVLLLEAKANPNFDEPKSMYKGCTNPRSIGTRPLFTSAVQCVLESARLCVREGTNNDLRSAYWRKKFIYDCIRTILARDKNHSDTSTSLLFEYMERTCDLGVDLNFLKLFLRFGADPDFKRKGKYPINVYFDKIMPYLTKFKVDNCFEHFQHQLENLMIMCHAMSQSCLKEAFLHFLDTYLFGTPFQGISVTRYFCQLVHPLVQAPLPLKTLVAHKLWKKLGRKQQVARYLPVSNDVLSLIIP